MVKATKKKKNNFDYEADWVPQKGRVFRMKPSSKGEEEQEEDPKPVFTPGSPFGLRPLGKRQDQRAQAPTNTPQAAVFDPRSDDLGSKLYSDSEGLDMAYGDQSNMFLDPQGTLFVSGTKGGFLGQEWK